MQRIAAVSLVCPAACGATKEDLPALVRPVHCGVSRKMILQQHGYMEYYPGVETSVDSTRINTQVFIFVASRIKCYSILFLYLPLLFLILQATTLYSGHMASESLILDVILFSMISGKWKVLLSMPGFTSSVIFALISTLPRGDSTQTISPSLIRCLRASSSQINNTSSVRISALRVRLVMVPQL